MSRIGCYLPVSPNLGSPLGSHSHPSLTDQVKARCGPEPGLLPCFLKQLLAQHSSSSPTLRDDFSLLGFRNAVESTKNRLTWSRGEAISSPMTLSTRQQLPCVLQDTSSGTGGHSHSLPTLAQLLAFQLLFICHESQSSYLLP